MSNTLGELETISIEDIIIPEDRRELDDGHVEALKKNILAVGLINPITVYRPHLNGKCELRCGYHRLEACKRLKLKIITARVYDQELSEYDRKAIEVYENLARKQLTQVEEALALKELHELMVARNGPKVSTTPGATGHSLRDTAKLVGKSPATVSQDLKLAAAIKAMPNLGLEKLDNKAQVQAMLRRMKGVTASLDSADKIAELPKEDPKIKLIESYVVGDFFKQTLEAGKYNFIECDPVYGVDLANLKKVAVTDYLEDSYNEFNDSDYFLWLCDVTARCYAAAKDDAWMILWCSQGGTETAKQALDASGWNPCIVPAIWYKSSGMSPGGGQSNQPDLVLGNNYETFIYAYKGRPTLRSRGRSNVFHFAPMKPQDKRHPTQKPFDLMLEILRTFIWEHSEVLVPFAGSGVTLLAAQAFSCNALGFDLSEEAKAHYTAYVMEKQ